MKNKNLVKNNDLRNNWRLGSFANITEIASAINAR
jgi:hypothetical protein